MKTSARLYDFTNFKAANMEFTSDDLIRIGDTWNVECGGRAYRIHRYADHLSATDITDGMKRGKTCKQIVIGVTRSHRNDGLLAMSEKELSEFIGEIHAEGEMHPVARGYFTITVRALKSVRVFNLKNCKKLNRAPKKWKVSDAVRALACGQAVDVLNTYSHSNNYKGRGPADAVELAKRVYEDPSGWHVREYNGKIELNCYSFDQNKFVFTGPTA